MSEFAQYVVAIGAALVLLALWRIADDVSAIRTLLAEMIADQETTDEDELNTP